MILEPGVLLRSGLLLTAFPGGMTGPDSLGKPGHGLPKGWGSGKDPQVLPDSVPPGCLRLAGGGGLWGALLALQEQADALLWALTRGRVAASPPLPLLWGVGRTPTPGPPLQPLRLCIPRHALFLPARLSNMKKGPSGKR